MLTLLGMTKKSLAIKACCASCLTGKPCCGSMGPALPRPRFEQRGGVLLPRREILRPRAMLRGGYPAEHEWGGLFRPWTPPGLVTLDLSCSPCCTTCSCDDIPDTVIATVIASTANCAAFVGSTATLTEAALGTTTDNQWEGTFDSSLGLIQMFCGNGSLGCDPNAEVSISMPGATCPIVGCDGTFSSGACRKCYNCLSPFSMEFTMTISASSLCCGFGGTKTVTIEITE